MKKIILSAFVLGIITTTSVQAAPIATPVTIAVNQDQETPVKPEDLPAAVKTTLASEEFAEWKVITAYSVTKEKGTFYKINLQKGEETKLVKLDADGQVVKEKDGE